MAYQDWSNELRGYYAKLDIFLAQKIINRAWVDIQKKRLWSFLIQDSQLLVPPPVIAGTVSTVQYSDIIIFDATATAAINLISVATPVTQQQFRLPGFPVYNIVSWNPANGQMKLDRLFGGPTQSSQSYQIYQVYYGIDPHFRKWLSVFDPINAYSLIPNKSSQLFDRWDPQRESTQFPYFLGYYKVTNGQALYELWPVPTQQIAYRAKYVQGFENFVRPTDCLPQVISEDLLMQRAHYLACQWASKMAGTYRELAGVNWNSEKADHHREYTALLRDAELEDEDAMQTMLIDNGDSDLTDGYPFTAEWYQHHDVVPGGAF